MKRSRFPQFLSIPVIYFRGSCSPWFHHHGTLEQYSCRGDSGNRNKFLAGLGLFLLSRILFGGFPGKPGWAGHGRRRHEMEEMREKWFNLSPEEKMKFKQDWRNRFRTGPAPASPEGPAAE